MLQNDNLGYSLILCQGADYKFGVVVETSNGFATAPDPIMKALSRLTWGGSTAVTLTADHVAKSKLSVDPDSMPGHFIDFNEQLVLGYFQKSQISVSVLFYYHKNSAHKSYIVS